MCSELFVSVLFLFGFGLFWFCLVLFVCLFVCLFVDCHWTLWHLICEASNAKVQKVAEAVYKPKSFGKAGVDVGNFELERLLLSCFFAAGLPNDDVPCQLPAAGWMRDGRVRTVHVPFGKCKPLALKVVWPSDVVSNPISFSFGWLSFCVEEVAAEPGVKSNGARKFVGTRTFRGWGSIRRNLRIYLQPACRQIWFRGWAQAAFQLQWLPLLAQWAKEEYLFRAWFWTSQVLHL